MKAQGLKHLGYLVEDLTKTSLLKRGIHRHRILFDWPQIVGEKLCELCLPERITRPKSDSLGATLHLRVTLGAALLVESAKDLIMEKINAYYGFKMIAELKILQAPLPALLNPHSQNKTPQKNAERHIPSAFYETLEKIEDPNLKAALLDLSHAFKTCQ